MITPDELLKIFSEALDNAGIDTAEKAAEYFAGQLKNKAVSDLDQKIEALNARRGEVLYPLEQELVGLRSARKTLVDAG